MINEQSLLGMTGLALLLSTWAFYNICAEISVLNGPFTKVPRLTSEGKYAEAGIPLRWHLLNFLKPF